MNYEDIGQAALDVEMAVLIQEHSPGDRMTHRSTPDTVKDLSGNKLESRLRTRRVLQLLNTSRHQDGGKERIPDARSWIESRAFIVRERVIGVLKF